MKWRAELIFQMLDRRYLLTFFLCVCCCGCCKSWRGKIQDGGGGGGGGGVVVLRSPPTASSYGALRKHSCLLPTTTWIHFIRADFNSRSGFICNGGVRMIWCITGRVDWLMQMRLRLDQGRIQGWHVRLILAPVLMGGGWLEGWPWRGGGGEGGCWVLHFIWPCMRGGWAGHPYDTTRRIRLGAMSGGRCRLFFHPRCRRGNGCVFTTRHIRRWVVAGQRAGGNSRLAIWRQAAIQPPAP